MSISNLGLDAFAAIAETGTIVQASKILGVTQTALTQRIKSLEAEVGVSLFIRSRKGMKLTREGLLLLQYTHDRAKKENEVLRKLLGQDSLEPIRIKLSGPTLQTQRRVLKEISKLKSTFSEVYFEFDIDDGGGLEEKLKLNKVDFILTNSAPATSLCFKKLQSSRFVLTGPYSWRGLPIKNILETKSIIDFNHQDLYTLNFLKKMKLLPKVLPQRHFINNTHQMLKFVEQGLGYAVFDLMDVKPLIAQKKLCNLAPDFNMQVNWYLCWNNYGPEMNPVFKAFIESIN